MPKSEIMKSTKSRSTESTKSSEGRKTRASTTTGYKSSEGYGDFDKIISGIKRAMGAASFVLDHEVTKFFTLQNQLRQKAGRTDKEISSPSKTFALFESLITQRNHAAKAARTALGKAKDNSSKIAALSKDFIALEKVIWETLGNRAKEKNYMLRREFYPSIAEFSLEMEAGPEDALASFLVLNQCLSFYNSSAGWELDNYRLTGLFAELGYILDERTGSKTYVIDSINSCVGALDRILNLSKEWASDSKRKDNMWSPDLSLSDYREAKKEAEITELLAKMMAGRQDSKKMDEAKNKQLAAKNKAVALAGGVYSVQKKLRSHESYRWLQQRNWVPEIYSFLQPNFTDVMINILCSIDISFSKKDYANLLWYLKKPRGIADYREIRYISPNLASAKYGSEPCLLEVYSLFSYRQIRAMAKSLVIRQKLDLIIQDKISSMFIDNGNFYIHRSGNSDNFWDHFKKSQFHQSAYLPVMLIRNMIHVVINIHKQGIIVGDIQTSSWFLSKNNLPRLSTFGYAKLLSQLTTSRESVGKIFPDKKFRPPELNQISDSSKLSEKSDIYCLGMCITKVMDIAKDVLKSTGIHDNVQKLVDKMTDSSPDKRPTAINCYNITDGLMGDVQKEKEEIFKQREVIDKLSKALKKAHLDAKHAKTMAGDEMGALSKRLKELEWKKKVVASKQQRMIRSGKELEGRIRSDESLRVPDYWETKSDKQWEIVAIEKKSNLFRVFRYVMAIDDPASLNKGRDVVEKGEYTYLDLIAVWRMENPLLWRNYAVERKQMRDTLSKRGIVAPPFRSRPVLEAALKNLPGYRTMYRDINETYLIHGTGPDVILSIATNGVNERFTSAALFGKGSYYAEDSAKNDQYCRGDAVLGGHPDLHKKLFPTGGEYSFPEYPYKCYYLVLCRMLMGYIVRVKCVCSFPKKMYNIDFPDAKIFSTDEETELSPIAGLKDPPIFYHTLLAEKGGALLRFREICQFHSVRVYPEYLMCYSRK